MPSSLKHILLILAVLVGGSVALAQEDAKPFSMGDDSMNTAQKYELPVATFEHYGKMITLYSTDYAGLYVENSGRRWIFIPKGQTEADVVDKARKNDFSDWFKRGEFKLYDESNLKEVQRAKQMDPTNVAGVFKDHRGKEWIWVPDVVAAGEKPRMYLVRIDNLTPEEMLRSLRPESKNSPLMESLKVYPREQLKFSSALLLVQMTKCFGGGLADLSFKSSNALPTCVDDFITHLLDPKGWISFYFFILANRIATDNLMKLSVLTLQAAKMPQALPFVRARIAPFLPFLGMAAGSLASSVAMHVLSAPSWGQCAELFSKEGFTSLPCREAYSHLLSVEDFWGDFAGETGSMISAAAAAHATQLLIKNSANLMQFQWNQHFQRGAKFAVDGNIKAIEYTSRFGIKAVKDIRMVRGAMTLAGGVAGFAFFVTTELGSYILFLAWDEVIRAPFMREYNSITKGMQITEGMSMIDNALIETDKLNWEKPYLTQECTMPYRPRIMIAPIADFMMEIQQRLSVKPTCTNFSPMDAGIGKLVTSAKKYRQTVLLSKMDEASMNWKNKVGGFLNSYRISKMLAEYIHQNKDRRIKTSFDVWLTSVYFTRSWREALDKELPVMNDFKENLYAKFDEMEPLITRIGELQALQRSESSLDKLKAITLNWTNAIASAFSVNKKSDLDLLKEKLIAAKAYVKANVSVATYTDRLGVTYPADVTPMIQKVYNDYDVIDFNALETADRTHYIKEDNNDIMNYLVYSFGPKAVNQVLHNMFCSQNSDRDSFQLDGVQDFGRKAAFQPPFLLKLTPDELTEYFRQNCVKDGMFTDYFEESDFSKTWKFKNRAYPDPLSLAMDLEMPLVSGQTTAEAQEWWRTKAFTPTMTFVSHAVSSYQEIINNELLPLIPQMTPDQLIAESAVKRRNLFGQEYTQYRVGSDGFLDYSTLSRSIMAQVSFALDKIKSTPHNNPRIPQLTEAVAQSMARLLLAFRQISSVDQVREQMTLLQTDLVSLKLEETNAIELRLTDFDREIENIVIPLDAQTSIIGAMELVSLTTSELYHELTGVWLDDMTEEKVKFKAGYTSEELGNVSKEQYKKYIYFKLLHENVNDIVIDYLTLDLYKKLSLQPLLEITNPESL